LLQTKNPLSFTSVDYELKLATFCTHCFHVTSG
jgi:hypothetical protein